MLNPMRQFEASLYQQKGTDKEVISMLQTIKDDLQSDMKHSHHLDCLAEQLSKHINTDFEMEFMQIQTYQGLKAQTKRMQMVQEECEKIGLLSFDAVYKMVCKSRRALGQSSFTRTVKQE